MYVSILTFCAVTSGRPFATAQDPAGVAKPANQSAPAEKLNLVPVLVPKGTKVKLCLARPLCTTDCNKENVVSFVLAEDVVGDGGTVILKKGTPAAGRVIDVQNKLQLNHWVGGIEISAEALATSADQQIPLQIVPSKGWKGYRSHRSIAAPQATPSEHLTFVSKKVGQWTNLLQFVNADTATMAKDMDPNVENGAIVMDKMLNFDDINTYVASHGATQIKSFAAKIKKTKTISGFTKSMGLGSICSLATAGLGIWELTTLVKGLFQHVTLSTGALFDATVGDNVSVMVAMPKGVVSKGGPLKLHVRPPSKFTGVKNTEIKMEGE